MDKDSAIELIRSSRLGARVAKIAPHLAPGIRIHATRDVASDRALVSRFGGHGVLPRGASWPAWDNTAACRRWIEWHEERVRAHRGSQTYMRDAIERYRAEMRDNPKPLDFLAMIRLADVAPYSQLVGLPDHGALLFFFDDERYPPDFWPEARGGWSILHAEDERDLVLVENPPTRRAEFHSTSLRFEIEYALPDEIRQDNGDDDQCSRSNADYERVVDALRGLGNGDDAIIHQLGGMPVEVQQDLFRTCQLASNGVACGSPEETQRQRERVIALEPGAKDWRLVLQIDSDERGPGWMWGDVGRLYYCLHRDDLAARRFDRSWCVMQCG